MQPSEELALRMWQALIACAHEHRTITYSGLSHKIGHRSSRIGHQLDRIKAYREVNRLPPLTVLVVYKVGSDRGRPNSEGCGVPIEQVNIKRMDVFDYKWFERNPPTLSDLRL